MHKFLYSLLLGLNIVFFSGPDVYSQKNDSLDKNIVRNLNQDWLVFDPHYSAYVPYRNNERGDINSISQKLDLQPFRGYNLNFVATPGLSLFFNGKLYYSNSTGEDQQVKLPIQSLNQGNFSGNDLLTFYNAEKSLPYKTFYIGFSIKAMPVPDHRENNILILSKREIPSGHTIFILVFLLILFLFALVKNKYYKRFSEFYDFTRLLPSTIGDDKNLLLDVFSLPSIIFVLINSLSWGLFLAIIKECNNDLFTSEFAGIISVVLIIAMIYFLKYFYLEIMGWIFNLRHLVKIQFFELVKVSLKINLFLVPVLIISYYTKGSLIELSNQWFIYILLICFFISIIRSSSLIFKLTAFRNIYLFSYLCTTEILPLVIIIKLILF